MNLERYPYYANPSFFDFEFESEGAKGTIKKIARFSTIGTNLYNFGFGDLDEATGDISDDVVTNNGDGRRCSQLSPGSVGVFFILARFLIISATTSSTG